MQHGDNIQWVTRGFGTDKGISATREVVALDVDDQQGLHPFSMARGDASASHARDEPPRPSQTPGSTGS